MSIKLKVEKKLTKDSFDDGVDAATVKVTAGDVIEWEVENVTNSEIIMGVRLFSHLGTPKTLSFSTLNPISVAAKTTGWIKGVFPVTEHPGGGTITVKYETLLMKKGSKRGVIVDPDIEVDPPPTPQPPPFKPGRKKPVKRRKARATKK